MEANFMTPGVSPQPLEEVDKPTGSRTVGASHERREDARLIVGQGSFVADFVPEDCLHAVFVRSAVASARLTRIDPVDAMALPGVVAVFTGAQFASLPPHRVNPVIGDARWPAVSALANGTIHAAGQPVALVVGQTLEAAQDAAEAVDVRFEELDPIVCPRQAISHAPIYPGMASNVAGSHDISSGNTEAAFSAADVIVTAEYTHPRLFPAPLEGRTTLAEWRPEPGMLTVHASSQTPHRFREEIARVLRLDADAVRVVAPDVGGAFGGKASICAEDVAVCFAARHLGLPIKWVAQRSEDFLSTAQGRGAMSRGALALSSEGQILGLRAELLFPLGWWVPFSGLVPAWNAARILPGPYDIPSVSVSAKAVMTNSPPIGIYRGAGRPEATLFLETLIDKAASALKTDPRMLRRRNLHSAQSLPTQLPGGSLLDSGDYEAALQTVERLASRNFATRGSTASLLRGTGIAMFVEPCGQGWESARLTLEPDGRVRLATGSTAQGQGRETAYAQIAANVLKRSQDDIDVIHGDTLRTPNGIGALASRSTAIGGSAVVKCAERFMQQLQSAAGSLLNCLPDDVVLREHHAEDRKNPGNRLSWRKLAEGADTVVSASVDYEVDHEAWSYGCCMAQVEIDPETGSLDVTHVAFCDDAGTVVNPMLVDGQIHGGIAQGIGEACLEQVAYDDQGQLLSGSLMDYALPRADDMPDLFTAKLQTPSLFNALGARGVGESGTIGTQPAILNAVRDALKAYDFGDLDMPLTSEKLWHILAQGPLVKQPRSKEKSR